MNAIRPSRSSFPLLQPTTPIYLAPSATPDRSGVDQVLGATPDRSGVEGRRLGQPANPQSPNSQNGIVAEDRKTALLADAYTLTIEGIPRTLTHHFGSCSRRVVAVPDCSLEGFLTTCLVCFRRKTLKRLAFFARCFTWHEHAPRQGKFARLGSGRGLPVQPQVARTGGHLTTGLVVTRPITRFFAEEATMLVWPGR